MSASWNNILKSLAETVEPSDFKVWLAPVRAEISDHSLSLHLDGCSNYMRRRLEQKMGGIIRTAASRELRCRPEELNLRFFSAPAAEAKPQQAAPVGALPGTEKFRSAPARQQGQGESSGPAKSPAAAGGEAPLPAAAAPGARTLQPQALVSSLPLDQPATLSGDALLRRQWRYSFEDFVAGPSNAMALAAAEDVCRPEGSVETLFVSADPGLGKTHIVQSAVRRILTERGPRARVAYLTADEFYARFRMGLRSNTLDDFQDRVRALDFLLVDDVQFLQRKQATQELLLSLVKHLQNRGSRVVFTSRCLPRELKALDPQLLSLFSSGILASMSAPSLEMRREILRRKALAQRADIPDEVTDLLAGSLQGDVRLLESCLKTLLLRMRVQDAKASPDLALEVLRQFQPAGQPLRMPSFEELLDGVSRCCGLSPRQLSSGLRRRSYVEARNVLFYLARKYTDLTLVQIGARVNKRHSTVIKGIAAVEHSLSCATSTGRQTARLISLIETDTGCRRKGPAED